MLEQVKVYIWLVFIGFVGGLLRLKEKTKLSNCVGIKGKIICLLFGIISSVFVAYLIYEISYFYLNSDRLAVALAGVGAWMGTDGLIQIEKALLEFLKNKIKGQ